MQGLGEIVIPPGLQALTHIISCLADSPCDEVLMDEIFDAIKISSDNYTSIAYILNKFSYIFPKRCSAYAKIYQSMKSKFNYDFNPRVFHIKEENEIFPSGSIEHLIVWDKYDDFVLKIENDSIDINREIDQRSLIDIACKFSSENCFTYLKLKGAIISQSTYTLAIEGGNKNIIMSLYNDMSFEIKGYHLITALKYHHNDIFEWLLETKGYFEYLVPTDCFYYGNVFGLLFLAMNGFSLDEQCITQNLFIIPILNPSFKFIYHLYNGFINHVCLTLLYIIHHLYKELINHICISLL